ncbi:hypothetical protein EJ02DRAFT_33428 [Clathrospora elynae]|uniref:Uncharacterized protein n=1 Tax=Clathrospora elynae TaxID=706981 RepID=A0A6A5T1L2_9PLEO|nr:hypothetical protein EJ02DRAFT_33428 [Clathrospora elynae]
MVQSRNFYLSLAGVVAGSSTAADTILSILEAASFSSTRSSLLDIAALASTFDIASLCCIGFYTFQEVMRTHSIVERSAQARKALVTISVLVSATALVTSLVLIILIKSRWEEATAISTTAPVSNWNSHASGQIAMWTISCVSQLVLYSSPLWHRKAAKVLSVNTSGPRDSVMSEHRPVRPNNLFIMEPTQSSSPLAPQLFSNLGTLPSPTCSIRSSHSLQSIRDSLRYVVRPVTSRTTLISQRSCTRDAPSVYSNRQSFDTISHSDGFDSWDTSHVSLPARDVVLQTAPFVGTSLEPIPGSRSASPARALEGPFLFELPEEEENPELTPPRMMPDTSRPSSPIVNEGHIHPLFRSESPAPAPAATPGTSILASPLATQAIAYSPRPFSRMKSTSQLNAHASSVTQGCAASLQSLSRSPSPPSRGLTPPIPDFVLNSSPRSSMSGSRKVNLQHSPDR